MANPLGKDWRQLAEAARQEQDPDRLMKLVAELNRVLEERFQNLRENRLD